MLQTTLENSERQVIRMLTSESASNQGERRLGNNAFNYWQYPYVVENR